MYISPIRPNREEKTDESKSKVREPLPDDRFKKAMRKDPRRQPSKEELEQLHEEEKENVSIFDLSSRPKAKRPSDKSSSTGLFGKEDTSGKKIERQRKENKKSGLSALK